MTETQLKALLLLGRAYVEDLPVKLGSITGRKGDEITISRRVARVLIALDYARPSEPLKQFLLITEAGKAAVLSGVT